MLKPNKKVEKFFKEDGSKIVLRDNILIINPKQNNISCFICKAKQFINLSTFYCASLDKDGFVMLKG